MWRSRPGLSMCHVPESDLQPHTLIVYVNHAVGTALVHRLIGEGVVAVGSVDGAVQALHGPSRYEAVIACPYLAGDELETVLDACRARRPRPAVVQLTDIEGDRPGMNWLPGAQLSDRALERIVRALA